MTILFLYQNSLVPEAGGTERATSLVMEELARRGHRTIGLLHCLRNEPDIFYLNNQPIDSLSSFLKDNKVDVVVNQIAYHHWLLESFLLHGGTEWHKQGGKIISFMHLDPTPAPKKKLSRYFYDWRKKSLIGKIKRLALMFYLPYLNYQIDKTYKYGMKYLYDHSDRYILMSQGFLNIFSKISNIKKLDKVRCITNMLTFPDIESPNILKRKTKTVLVVARMDDEQKNISFIIDVWKSIKDHNGYSLHIVGDGCDKERLERRAKGVTDIIFEGQQSPLDWYRRAKIFLMASPREGWGLTLTESHQCGVVPVVLNTSLVFPDIISDGSNGFLVSGKSQFIERLNTLLHDDRLLKSMALNALTSAYRFTPSKVGDDWQEVLSEFTKE